RTITSGNILSRDTSLTCRTSCKLGCKLITAQERAATAPGPWVACLAPACSPGQGTPCPWLAELPGLA
ncbi:hypothetical protein HaLaN_30048, partial [Haematococcus lacustris]